VFPVVLLGGKIMATTTPATHARGHIVQNKALHVVFETNPAAMNGPIAFPRPTQDPIMPWYLLSSQNLGSI